MSYQLNNLHASNMKQQQIFKQLVKAYRFGTLSHAYIFHGSRGVGKKECVQRLAQAIFCEQLNDDGVCGVCTHCQRIQKNEFQDVQYIEADNQTIKIDQIRQLKNDVSFSSMEHDKKVYVIYDIEKMSVPAANSLLKFLEEPNQQVYFLLTTSQVDAVLPTIRSRAQLVACHNQTRESIQSFYQENGLTQQQAYILSYVLPDTQLGMELIEQDDFQSFYQVVVSWAMQWVEGDTNAYIAVQTKLARYFSNKEWVNIGLDIVMTVVRDAMFSLMVQQSTALYTTVPKKMKKGVTIDAIVQAKRMLSSNVSAQVCYEWLALQVR
ncbi:DNA polymerase III subunit delta' [Carnobacteriaceae bacterium zg-ZUI240]|nr:DNA polymerase III subunit delta' [Carnobacteriaceae bacterium zg-ZUI240]